MPPCSNDPTRTYAGTEPSPKGLGHCAHAEDEGAIRQGRDGQAWVVRKNKRGSLSWVHHDTLSDKLSAQLGDWWSSLSDGGVMIVRKNGSYAMVTSKKVTRAAQRKDVEQQWRSAASDPDVVAIVWSAMSSDAFEFFIGHIRKNVPSEEQHALASSWSPVALLAKSHRKYFMKYEYFTPKDFTLKGSTR